MALKLFRLGEVLRCFSAFTDSTFSRSDLIVRRASAGIHSVRMWLNFGTFGAVVVRQSEACRRPQTTAPHRFSGSFFIELNHFPDDQRGNLPPNSDIHAEALVSCVAAGPSPDNKNKNNLSVQLWSVVPWTNVFRPCLSAGFKRPGRNVKNGLTSHGRVL